MNRRFFLAARQRVQAHSALAPQRQFKIQNSKFEIRVSGIGNQNSKFMTSNLQSTFFDRGLFGFLKVLLRGAGQVMFQGNSWTGLFFIAGIFWGACMSDNCNVAWGALLGLMVSTATGYLLSLPEKDGHEGLWGFNGILVGCAFPTFMGNTLWMWIALAFCAAMTTWVRSALNNMMRTYKVNSFTFPFVLSTWIFLLAAHLMPALDLSNISAPELPSHITSGGYLYFHDLVQYILRGISQVFLIDSWVTGMLFLIGLALASSWAALWAIVGSALSIFTAAALGASAEHISHGLYSFSAVLTAIAIATVFYKPSLRSAIWALLGIIATVIVQAAMNVMMMPVGIVTLTAPFCITTWLFLMPLLKLDKEEPDHSDWHGKGSKSRVQKP